MVPLLRCALLWVVWAAACADAERTFTVLDNVDCETFQQLCCGGSCCDNATCGDRCNDGNLTELCSATPTVNRDKENVGRATRWYMIGGIVSLMACLAMLVSYSSASRKQQMPPANLLRTKTLCDTGSALAYIIPAFWADHTDRAFLCSSQAAMIQFFSTASLAWWLSFSIELLLSIRNPFTDHYSHLAYYHIGAWAFALSTTIILLTTDEVGLTDFDFCWIDPASDTNLAIGIFYAPVAACYAFSFVILFWVTVTAKVVIPVSHSIRAIAIQQSQWHVALIGLFWTYSGVVWFGAFGERDSLELIVLMSFSIALRGILTLAVWLITARFAAQGYDRGMRFVRRRHSSQHEAIEMTGEFLEASMKNSLNAGLLNGESDSNLDRTSESTPPEGLGCYESIPLKWALRRDVMLACQQGIDMLAEAACEQAEKLPPGHLLRPSEFSQEVIKQLDRRDSDTVSFTFYDYAPLCFHRIRAASGMTPMLYRSVFSYEHLDDQMMEKFSDGGSSGSFFYFTSGKEFIVKTITPAESRLLLDILPDYYKHITKYDDSLIVRFYGLHAIKMHSGAKHIHFVVMDNVFLTRREITEVYDVKGSWVDRGPVKKKALRPGEEPGSLSRTAAFFVLLQNRADRLRKKKGKKEGLKKSGKSSVASDDGGGGGSRVLKDLDLSGVKRVVIDEDARTQIVGQMEKDCEFFVEHGIMDYSLLLGVHKAGFDDIRVPRKDLVIDFTAPIDSVQSPVHRRFARHTSGNGYHPPHSVGTINGKERSAFDNTHSSMRSAVEAEQEQWEVQNFTPPVYRRNEGGLWSAETDPERYTGDCMYFVGLIDILQTWTLEKRIERFFKVFFLRKDGKGMSAIEPAQYGSRFMARCRDTFTSPEHRQLTERKKRGSIAEGLDGIKNNGPEFIPLD
ncbi:Phosphatidylinositol 4-phosphate 5-kinase 1 [Diplonema papillatum]|nr:Phosphatidylinositol 4-phosphate 5-kinase 1 [Diplonema papillatum]